MHNRPWQEMIKHLLAYKRCMNFVMVAVCAGFAGCGNLNPPETAHEPAVNAAVPSPKPLQPPAPETPADPIQRKLVGTRWEVGGFEIGFLDAKKLLLKGGPLRDLAPAGLEVPYVYKEGALEIKALGQTRTGTWDGEQLLIDGIAAQKL